MMSELEILFDQNNGYLTRKELSKTSEYKRLRRLIAKGEVERIKSGVFRLSSYEAAPMIDIDRVVPNGVLCMYSAWFHYNLTVQIPQAFCVAIEKNRKVSLPVCDGVFFDTKTIKTQTLTGNKLYNGIRILYIVHLDSIRQAMQIDIGFGDVITPSPQNLRYPVFFDNLPMPEIYAYSLETVIAEKFHAMIELSETNSRFKDFYDVYKILVNNQVENDVLAVAICATFQNRKFQYVEKHPLFTKDFSTNENRNKQWKNFLKKIKYIDDLSFETVMNLIVSRLHPIYKTLKIL
jgi:hypothetical protein